MTSYIILLLVITFISRYWPRLIVKRPLGSDLYYHLLLAENIRNNDFKSLKRNPQFILPGECRYPIFYHHLLALFSKPAREGFAKVSSALFDSLLVATFYAVSWNFLVPLGWSGKEIFLLAAAFSVSPSLTGIGEGPRAYEGTPRTVGEFLACLVFLALWGYVSTGNLLFYGTAVLIGSAALNTSKFTAQVFLFFSVIIAVIVNSTGLLLFMPLTIIGAIVVSNGNYWGVLCGQIAHLVLYAKRLMHQHPIFEKRTGSKLPKTVRELGRYVLTENTFLIFLMKHGLIFLALLLSFLNYDQMTHSAGSLYLFAWLVSGVITAIITSRKQFLFLGEADRYLEYVLLAGYLIFAITAGPKYIGLILCLNIVLYVSYITIFFAMYCSKSATNGYADFVSLVDEMNKREQTVVLNTLCGDPWSLAYLTAHDICFSEDYFANSVEQYDNYFWSFPYPRKDLDYFVSNYNVKMVPVSKKIITDATRKGCVYEFCGFEKAYENDTYELYVACS